jgi:5-(carboxyamino)imidazole ribonucleotide synthase
VNRVSHSDTVSGSDAAEPPTLRPADDLAEEGAVYTPSVSQPPIGPYVRLPDVQGRLEVQRLPITPPATIGLLGGGQLGRMLALAARALGYRIAVLDPDPACPAAALADRVVVAGYDDVGAALRLAELSDVVTYELEHVATDVVDAIDAIRPVRPGRLPLHVTQDRIAERQFLESADVEVAPWREIRTTDDLRRAAAELGLPMRLKIATGGYDGRGQLRLTDDATIDDALERLGRPAGEAGLAEAEQDFEAELSIVLSRSVAGHIAAYPLACNRHDRGILVESVAPAAVDDEVTERAVGLGERIAIAMGLTGTLTAELFLLRDGRLVVNELAPRVHNSGHWTIEGAATSQFEQHVRAICGLDLGSTAALAPTAVVNLLGAGRPRPARLEPVGLARSMADPTVHLHVYDKRRVFERRKMGHVTATGPTTAEALQHAQAAAALLHWSDDDGDGRDGHVRDGSR